MNHVKSMKMSLTVLMVIGLAVTVGVLCSEASALPHAGFTDPGLPPVHPNPLISYYGRGVQAEFLQQGVILADLRHHSFTDVVREADGADEIETFNSILDAIAFVGGYPGAPVRLTGPVTTRVRNKVGNTTGEFQTEIMSMSLVGNVGGMDVEIRESLDYSSPGVTRITDLGGELYEIDSFFDVFTELSVNGGPFLPAENVGRMELCPEPATMAMLIVGGLAVLRRRRRV